MLFLNIFNLCKSNVILTDPHFFEKNLDLICNSTLFSRMEFDLSQNCAYEDLLSPCKLWDCFLPEKETLVGKSNGKIMKVDLLKNPESFTNYKEGASAIWKKILNLNTTSVYKLFISGIHQNVSLHIAAFYLKIGNFYLKNLDLFDQKCKNEEFLRNLRELKFFLLMILKKMKQPEYQEIIFLITDHIIIKNNFYEQIKSFDIFNDIQKDLKKIDGIIGCISCQKCRLWSTIHFKGLFTALKVLNDEQISKKDFFYFINFLKRIFCAENEHQKMKKMMKFYIFYKILLYWREILTVFLSISIFYFAVKNKNEE